MKVLEQRDHRLNTSLHNYISYILSHSRLINRACQEMKGEKYNNGKCVFAAFIHDEKDACFGTLFFGVLIEELFI